MKKAGWDCFRHYEIIASGSMPYFLDIERLPSHTMQNFPVHLVQKAMQLPGVPSQDQVKRIVKSRGANSTDELKIDHSIFNRTAYNDLMEQLIQYSLQHLTWRAIAQNVRYWTRYTKSTPATTATTTHHVCYSSRRRIVNTRRVSCGVACTKPWAQHLRPCHPFLDPRWHSFRA